jgi:hypothetical protein
MGQGKRQMVAAKPLWHHCTRSAASVAQSAARHMTAGARRSLRVTSRWQSAGRMPCLHGAGCQADGGSEATSASLHVICRQRSAERGPPYDGRREAVTVCDTPLAWRSEAKHSGDLRASKGPCHHGTSDDTLGHFLGHECGMLECRGVVAEPTRARWASSLVPLEAIARGDHRQGQSTHKANLMYHSQPTALWARRRSTGEAAAGGPSVA